MKKIFTSLFCLLICANIFAQTNSIRITNYHDLPTFDKGIICDKVDMTGEEPLSHLIINPNPTTVSMKMSTAINEEIIGTTTYDLQSNACVMDRILMHNNGSISAAWTMSQLYNTSYADRGTGYNFFDGTAWGSQPTIRLESSRCGWPSMLATSSGREIAIAHNTDNSYFQMTFRSTIGSGVWEEKIISSYDSSTFTYRDLVWNRTAVGGANGETLHMVGVTSPSGLTGTPYNGLDGALLYYRSQDEGASWDIQDMQLPTLDTSNFSGFGGDSYAIDARGNTVVIAYFNDMGGDSFILKSTDNGTTWTRTTFLDFPRDNYVVDDGLDLDSNGVMDMIYSTDNYGAVILDHNDVAHVFYGVMRYLDDDLADGSYSWFPLTNGLVHWDENMGADYTLPTVQDTDFWYSDMMNSNFISAAPDLNGDSIVAGIDSAGSTWAKYYSSLSSMPSAGIAANGDMYVSFAGYTENADNGTQVFRHTYIIKSTDGGLTWTNPVDVTPNTIWAGMKECVFASMNKEVDDKVRLVYQRDMEPGLAVRGDEDFVDLNEIVYLEIDTNLVMPTSINNITQNNISLDMYPNPVNPAYNKTAIYFDIDKSGTVIVDVVDMLGREIYNYQANFSKGDKQEITLVDVDKYEAGIYYVNTTINGKSFSNKLVVTK